MVAADAARVVSTIVKALASARETTAAFERAETVLEVALRKSQRRVDFLIALAAEHENGQLSTEAHRRLLVVAARVLKSDADFAAEALRIVERGRS